jgi:hypothetical protein
MFQPVPLKNARATDSNKQPPTFKLFLSSSLERIAQLLIQKTPLKITLKIDTNCDFLKTKSFLLIQIAQHRAATPITTRLLCFFEKLLSQGQKGVAKGPKYMNNIEIYRLFKTICLNCGKKC